MITIFKLTENLQKFVDMQVTEMARTNPMIGFTKPLITRAAHNAIGKAHKAISLLADKDGNIDIENIISEMRDSIVTSQPFTVNLPVLGDVEIGNGLIMAVHIADKFLTDISLKTNFGIDVAVKVPRCVSVGTYKYDAILIRQLGESGLCMTHPFCVVVSMSMKQIDYGKSITVVVLFRCDYDVIHITFH